MSKYFIAIIILVVSITIPSMVFVSILRIESRSVTIMRIVILKAHTILPSHIHKDDQILLQAFHHR